MLNVYLHHHHRRRRRQCPCLCPMFNTECSVSMHVVANLERKSQTRNSKRHHAMPCHADKTAHSSLPSSSSSANMILQKRMPHTIPVPASIPVPVSVSVSVPLPYHTIYTVPAGRTKVSTLTRMRRCMHHITLHCIAQGTRHNKHVRKTLFFPLPLALSWIPRFALFSLFLVRYPFPRCCKSAYIF